MLDLHCQLGYFLYLLFLLIFLTAFKFQIFCTFES